MGRVGSRGVQNVTDLVGSGQEVFKISRGRSGQEVFKSHGSGRVGSKMFEISRVVSGRVKG